MSVKSRKLIKHVGRAIFRRFSRNRARNLPELLVCSPGGVATTALMRHLRQYKSINNPGDSDGLKHMPRPPGDYVKILFVAGDPEAVFVSLKRRGWVQAQSSKLGSLAGVVLRGQAQKIAFKRAVKMQLRRFDVSTKKKEILIVSYDELWERLHEIAEFAGIDDDRFIKDFPPRVRRLSDYSLENAGLLD